MANLRFLVSTINQIDSNAGASIKRRRVRHGVPNVDIIRGNLLLTILLILACLVSSNCLSFERLIPTNKQPVQQASWLPSNRYFYSTDQRPAEQEIKSYASSRADSSNKADELAEELASYNEQPVNYYSEPEVQYVTGRLNYGQREQARGRHLSNAELEALQEAQQLASRKSDYYYPLLISAPSSETSYSNDNDQQTIDFKNKLSDLAELEERFAQEQEQQQMFSKNFDNTRNPDNTIIITNPIVYPSPVESQDVQLRNLESRPTPDSSSRAKLEADLEEPQKSFTLMEDDGELLASNKNDKSWKQEVADKAQPPAAKSTPSYGTLAIKPAKDGQSEGLAEHEPPSSMFNRMYKTLAGYLPFLSQLNILRNNGSHLNDSSSNSATVQGEVDRFMKGLPTADKSAAAKEDTKQSVSRMASSQLDSALWETKPGQELPEESKEGQQASNEGKEATLGKVSLLSSSSLTLPLKSKDELFIQAESAPGGSLLGKYIYAPEHNTHLGSGSEPSVEEEENSPKTRPVKKLAGEYRPSKLSQRAAYKSQQRFQEEREEDEDEEVLAAEEADDELLGYKPRKAYHSRRRLLEAGEPIGSVRQNKTNDLYFLIMVGSFCAMAVAVVLAAGLFAYRVQQNRNSTTETDYPTYGVVGPNKMTGGGKLGAASFVGGYFQSNLGAGSGLSAVGGQPAALASQLASGKLVSGAKHLADLYSISDSGILTSSAGSNKSSSASIRRISSDQQQVASQHQHNQGNLSGKQSCGGQASGGYVASGCQDAARMYHYQSQKQQMIISERQPGRHNSASDLDSEDENDDGSYTVYECPGLASAHEMEIKNPLFNDDQTP